MNMVLNASLMERDNRRLHHFNQALIA